MSMIPRAFIRMLDELIEQAGERCLSDEAVADPLENGAGGCGWGFRKRRRDGHDRLLPEPAKAGIQRQEHMHAGSRPLRS